MATRPYFNLKGQELAELFRSCAGDPKILQALRAELVHRDARSMRDLRAKVDRALADSKKVASNSFEATGPRRPEQAELPFASTIVPENGEQPATVRTPPTKQNSEVSAPLAAGWEGLSMEPARGRLGSIRPCGVLRDVPARWTFPEKRDFELDVGKNAPRVDKFIVALRALVKDMRRRGSGMRTVTLQHGEAVALDGRERVPLPVRRRRRTVRRRESHNCNRQQEL
jgi:hypothetical protein